MRTNIKKIFAVLLTVALVATMFVMPANATKTYGDYLANPVPNGDFEVGVEGMTPYGWTFLPTTKAARLNANPNSLYKDGSWTFKTVVEDGNKVAKMHKLGAGYYYMGSQPIAVTGGKDYYITFDYKITDIETPEGVAFTDNFMGIIVSVRQYNANGELLNESGSVYDESSTVTSAEFLHRLYTSARTDAIGAEGEDDNYKEVTVKYTAAANAATVELYIGTGGYNAKCYHAVSFDNVSLTLKENSVYGVSNVFDGYNGNFNSAVANTYDLVNGDFEKIIYDADGARTAGIAGPAGWFSVGSNQGCNGLVSTHTNAGAKTYQVVTETEIDANGKVNTYAVFSLKHSYMSSSQNTNLIGSNTGDTKYYNYTHSNMMKIPVAAGETFTIKYRLKTKTADGSATIVHGTQATPSFAVMMFNANGVSTTVADGKTRFKQNINIEPGEWTEYSLTVTAPAESYGAVYYTVGINQNVARNQGISATAVNALYCVDDIRVEYEKAEETEAERYDRLGITEDQVGKNGYDSTTSTGNLPHLELQELDDGIVIKAPDSYKINGTNPFGYIVWWTSEKTSITGGDKIKVAFDNKMDGVEEYKAAYLEANGAAKSAYVEAPAILLRYYDANGNLLVANTSGTVLTADGAVASAGGYAANTDYDWQHSVRTVTAPADAVSVEYGYFVRLYNGAGSNNVEHYYANVKIASSTDAYWNSDEYEVISSLDSHITNLFDKVVLSNGNDLVVENDDLATLTNLVKMNNTIASTESAPYQSSEEAAFDMNQDGRITPEDIVLLRWKLLGITNEADAVQ